MFRQFPPSSNSGPSIATGAWMQRVGGFAELPRLVRQLGADPRALLLEAGLAPDVLDRPDGSVPYVAMTRVLHLAAERTRCAHFGLLAGRMWRLGDLGALGDVVRNCATVGEALDVLVVHQHLNSGGGLTFMTEQAGMVDLGYAIYHPGVIYVDQFYDSVLAASVNYLRELCGGGWVPSAVFVPHARPTDVTHYCNLLKIRPRFSAEFCAVRFPASWLTHPIEGADPQLHRIAESAVSSAQEADFVQRVFRALRTLLLEGRNSGDETAQMLSMHRRTLNRRLKDHGTTFQRVLDDVRFSIARQHLAASDISLDDVAATLGYGSVSPFMRTFRRWSGTTPGRWRRAFAS